MRSEGHRWRNEREGPAPPLGRVPGASSRHHWSTPHPEQPEHAWNTPTIGDTGDLLRAHSSRASGRLGDGQQASGHVGNRGVGK
jgi:hypothetical protein